MKVLCLLFSFMISFQTSGGLKEEIENFLNKKLQGYEKITFEISSSPALTPGETLRVDTLKEMKIKGGLAYIPVTLNNNNRASQSFVSIKLNLYKKVLVAKGTLPAGSSIRPEDFEFKSLDVAKLRGSFFTDVKLLEGLKARFTIKEGEVLISEKLEAKPVIKSGDSVTAFLIKGNVEISMDAVARQDGTTGQVIRVLTSDNKLLRARVIDQFSVNIIE